MHTQMQTGVRFNQQNEHFRWTTQDRISNLASVHKRSELSNVVERRERVPRCGDDDGGGSALPTTLEFLGMQVGLR